MATKPYDPITSIEGMFNGCITRIGQAIKDPVHFGPSTKGVLLECSKRFQDALDDCEVQILEAKFYLEHQLALNKARREAKAREEGAVTGKRKHDQIEDGEDKAGNAKRVKVEDKKPSEAETPVKRPEPVRAPESKKSEPEPEPREHHKDPTQKSAEVLKLEPPNAPDILPAKSPEKPPEEPILQTPALTDFPQPTPNATPAPTNDEFNFESMFGDPSADAGAGDGDMAFDLNLGDDFGGAIEGTNDANPQDQDFSSLLPGLESYANQAADDNGDPSNVMRINPDLPELPDTGPNDFDAFLDANDFNTDGSMNLNDDPMSNLENMDGIDFDSMF